MLERSQSLRQCSDIIARPGCAKKKRVETLVVRRFWHDSEETEGEKKERGKQRATSNTVDTD